MRRVLMLDYSTVWDWAIAKYEGLHWNQCNDLFFRQEYWDYESCSTIYMEELEAPKLTRELTAAYIEYEYLKAHDLLNETDIMVDCT